VVVGILLAGWSSNSKWRSSRHALRRPGHLVRDPAASRSCAGRHGRVALDAGDHPAAGRLALQWNLFTNPFALVAFGVFFISQLAEGNRTPFDLPEAESSSSPATCRSTRAPLALYFLVEFGNLWVMARSP